MQEHYLEDCIEKVRIFGVLRYFDVFMREIRERREREFAHNSFLFFGSNEGSKVIYSKEMTLRLPAHRHRANISHFAFFYFSVLTSIAYLKAFLDLD